MNEKEELLFWINSMIISLKEKENLKDNANLKWYCDGLNDVRNKIKEIEESRK